MDNVTDIFGIATDIIGDLSGASAAEAKAMTAQYKAQTAATKAESYKEIAFIVGGIIAAGLVGAAFIFRRG